MHIRPLTKSRPAQAQNVQEILDIINYILAIIGQIVQLASDLSKEQ